MKTKGVVAAAVAGALSLTACGESEIQVGSFKAKARLPSTKEAHDSYWDLFFEPSKRASSELLLAVKAGNEELVEELLSGRHDHSGDIYVIMSTEAKDAKGWTPLMWAVHYNHIGIAEKLLDEKANADARGDDGTTPLALAVRNNNKPLVKLLLEHCRSVDTPDQQGMTPLMLAVANNNLELVRILVREDVNPNLRNGKGKSAVEIAEDQGNWGAARLLLGEMEWDHIVTAEGGEFHYYLSPQTIRREESDSMSAWLKHSVVELEEEKPESPARQDQAYTLVQVMVQCRSRKLRELRGFEVGVAHKNVKAGLPSNWTAALPETVGGEIVSEVCEAGL